MDRRRAGFTLIELMIVVAVVAILAAIAYPSYIDQVRKARRADGKEALLRVQMEQEKWRANHTTYSNTLGGTNCGTTTATGLCLPSTSQENHYNIAITASSATGFTATATAQGDQANDKAGGASCSPLTLTVSTAGETRTPQACW